jgi:hypothetical protein
MSDATYFASTLLHIVLFLFYYIRFKQTIHGLCKIWHHLEESSLKLPSYHILRKLFIVTTSSQPQGRMFLINNVIEKRKPYGMLGLLGNAAADNIHRTPSYRLVR